MKQYSRVPAGPTRSTYATGSSPGTSRRTTDQVGPGERECRDGGGRLLSRLGEGGAMASGKAWIGQRYVPRFGTGVPEDPGETGARLGASAGEREGHERLATALESAGLADVRGKEFELPHWDRGGARESARRSGQRSHSARPRRDPRRANQRATGPLEAGRRGVALRLVSSDRIDGADGTAADAAGFLTAPAEPRRTPAGGDGRHR